MEESQQPSSHDPHAHELTENSNTAIDLTELATERILPCEPDLLDFQLTNAYDDVFSFSNQNFSQQTSGLGIQTSHCSCNDTINPSLLLQDTLAPQSSNQTTSDWELPGGHNLPQFTCYEPLSSNFTGDSWMNAQNTGTFGDLAAMPFYDNNQPHQPDMIPEMMAEEFCGLQQPQAFEDLRPSIEVSHEVGAFLGSQVPPGYLSVVDIASLQREKIRESSLCCPESSTNATTGNYTAPQLNSFSQSRFSGTGVLSNLESTADAFLAAETGEAVERISETTNSMQSNKVSTQTESVTSIGASQNSFGPSRPVSLPPLRRGGRKGPLTVEDKAIRKKTRKQGACIRCRLIKKTCSGGIPCLACCERSKAPRWKHPCVKAHFLDIVESGPFFQSVSEFERSAISTLTLESLIQQFRSTLLQGKLTDSTIINTGFPGPFGFPGFIFWPIASQVLLQVLARTGESDCSKTVLRHMSDVIRLRAKSNKCYFPIMFMRPPPKSTWKEWITLNTLFCVFPNIHKPSQNNPAPSLRRIPFKGVFETLAWVTRRHFEISLFSYLQKAANRLASVSGKELSEIAGQFLQVLLIGLSDHFAINSMRLGQDSDEARRMEAVYTERKRKVRLAISCYLRSALDKLDPWSDFWGEQEASITLIAPKALKSALSDLDAFDAKVEDTFTTYNARLKEWKEWQSDSSSPREESDEKHDPPKFDVAEFYDYLKMFTQNPPWKIDIQDILKSLQEHYGPKLKVIQEFYSDTPELAGVFDELVDNLKKHQRTLTRELEVLDDITESGEEGKSRYEAKAVIREATEFMNTLDQIFRQILRRLLDADDDENIQAPDPST